MITVDVRASTRTYPVVVGPGAAGELARLLPRGARRAAVVTQPGIDFEVDPGIEHTVFTIGEGESAKSLDSVEELCAAWSRWGLTRADAVVAVGGGVVTDTAGFAAAVYHRGVAVVHVATTLLGMVDAAIGGKTGVNLAEGKNLVGAFWQPHAVICDTHALATLPPRETRSGMGEMAKYHFLTGQDLLALELEQRIAACVRIKGEVIAADEHEDPANDRGRATLNYGHTLAHALETAGSYDLRHGEAVGIGLAFAAALAARLGRIGPSRVEAHRRVLGAYDLPMTLPPGSAPAELVELMARDKKAIDSLTFVLDGPERRRGRPRRRPRRRHRHPRGARVREKIVLLLSGPNLNLLGERQPLIYGDDTLDEHVAAARAALAPHGYELEHVQSNHEGDLIDAIHGARGRCAGIVINGAAFTHYAWGIHDALACFDGPVIEIHISNPHAPRGMAAPLGHLTGRDGRDQRPRCPRVPAGDGRDRPLPAATMNLEPHGRRRTRTAAAGPVRRRGHRRAAGHEPRATSGT